MPEIGRIQSTNFQSLLTELGITRNNVPFALRSEVSPVVLVGGTVSFIAAPTPPYRVVDIFTTGQQVAPAAATVLADTGPLPVGAYSVYFTYLTGEAQSVSFQWRDAANGASLWDQLFGVTVSERMVSFQSRFNVENENERFRVLQGGAGGGGITVQATILAKI